MTDLLHFLLSSFLLPSFITFCFSPFLLPFLFCFRLSLFPPLLPAILLSFLPPFLSWCCWLLLPTRWRCSAACSSREKEKKPAAWWTTIVLLSRSKAAWSAPPSSESHTGWPSLDLGLTLALLQQRRSSLSWMYLCFSLANQSINQSIIVLLLIIISIVVIVVWLCEKKRKSNIDGRMKRFQDRLIQPELL